MKRRTLYFLGPRKLEVREEGIPAIGADEVLVRTEVTGISAGTEMLVYRGDFPQNLPDANDSISSAIGYPLPYGYAAVGSVVQVGSGVDPSWDGRAVFTFKPHSSHHVAKVPDLVPLPAGLSSSDGTFLPNMETAVNLIQDSAPLLGERCLVLGQGIVGLLTASLLHEFPLECLVTADGYERRRQASMEVGVTDALDPTSSGYREHALALTGPSQSGYDFVVELTGNPAAVDDAIALTAFSGRVILGSWFGTRRAPIDLGGRFHRSRMRLISSQVSSIDPSLSGRWNKDRRYGVAWGAIARLKPARWISHVFPLERAAEAYQLLDGSSPDVLQAVFTYH